MRKLKSGDKIEVRWTDANSRQAWHDTNDIKKVLDDMKPEHTIGYFIMYYRGWLVVAMTKDENDSFADWGFWKAIPRGMIKSIKLIN